jgi:hypothetical protein
LLVFALVTGPCRAASIPHQQLSVLFVGNSLTYVANTPAVFDALAAAGGAAVSSDMIVKGGATLSQRVADGSIARALGERHYNAVVLQERGGDLMCAFGPDSCADSRKAIRAVVAMAQASGAKVYLLGTYQGNAAASRALVAAESGAAAEVGIPYLEVSEKLQALRASAPGLGWQASDGMHPGPALALLNAIILHRALLGTSPKPVALEVVAPIYGATSGLTEALRRAEDAPPLADTPRRIEYPPALVETVLQSLDAGAMARLTVVERVNYRFVPGRDGILSIDGRTVPGGPVKETWVAPGRRTIGYACPGWVTVDGPATLSRTFVAGGRYQLTCEDPPAIKQLPGGT